MHKPKQPILAAVLHISLALSPLIAWSQSISAGSAAKAAVDKPSISSIPMGTVEEERKRAIEASKRVADELVTKGRATQLKSLDSVLGFTAWRMDCTAAWDKNCADTEDFVVPADTVLCYYSVALTSSNGTLADPGNERSSGYYYWSRSKIANGVRVRYGANGTGVPFDKRVWIELRVQLTWFPKGPMWDRLVKENGGKPPAWCIGDQR